MHLFDLDVLLHGVILLMLLSKCCVFFKITGQQELHIRNMVWGKVSWYIRSKGERDRQ